MNDNTTGPNRLASQMTLESYDHTKIRLKDVHSEKLTKSYILQKNISKSSDEQNMEHFNKRTVSFLDNKGKVKSKMENKIEVEMKNFKENVV